MNREFAERFLTRLAMTAMAGDHAAHMELISKKVLLYGVPVSTPSTMTTGPGSADTSSPGS